MVNLLLALVPLGVILVSSELLWRKKMIFGERGRKFVHVLAGVYMAFWTKILPLDGIAVLGLMAFVFLLYSRFSPIFHAVYTHDRRTYGELFFALAILVCALLASEPWIYTTAILFLAVADGGAAVFGKLLGKKNSYNVFGSKDLKKSIAGTSAYILLAYVCLFVGLSYSDTTISAMLLLLPLGGAVLENISPYGLDDLVVPVYVVLMLNMFV